VDGNSLLLEVTLDHFTFLPHLQQATNTSLYCLFVVGHPLEQVFDALGKIQQLVCSWRLSLVFGFVQEVPLYQQSHVFFTEVLTGDLALEQQLKQVAADLQLMHFLHSCTGEPLPAAETRFLELFYKELEKAAALESELPDEVEPVDVDGL
jgi:hypothetical protein